MTKRIVLIPEAAVVFILIPFLSIMSCSAAKCRVSNLQVNILTADMADVRWSKPVDLCVKRCYEVSITTSNKEALKIHRLNRNEKLKSLQLPIYRDMITFDDLGLLTCVRYNFSVTTVACLKKSKRGPEPSTVYTRFINREPFASITYDMVENRTVRFILEPSPSIALCKPEYNLTIFSPAPHNTDCSAIECMDKVFEASVLNDTSVDVGNLEDCVNYLAFVGLQDEEAMHSNQTLPLTVDFSPATENGWTVNNFTVKDVGSEWIHVTWLPPVERPHCLKRYELEVHSADRIVERITVDRNSTEFNVTHPLEPCTTYKFVLKMFGVKQTANETLVRSTLPVVPGKVKNLHVVNATSSSMTVQWTKPVLGMACAVNYVLVFTDYEGSLPAISIPLNQTDYTKTDLRPCMNYSIDMWTKGETHDSPPVKIQNNTGLEVPDTVENLQVSEISKRYVSLTWQPPRLYRTCVAGYELKWFAERAAGDSVLLNQTSVEPVSGTNNYTVTDLEPCSAYLFTVVVKGKLGDGGTVNKTARTVEEVPGPVLNLTVESQDFQLFVTWEPPEIAIQCVADYIVHNQPINGSKVMNAAAEDKVFYSWISHRTPNTTRILPDLAACVEYKIIVAAVTSNKVEGPPVSFIRTTLPHVFERPKQGKIIEMGKKTALFSWQVPFTNRNQCPMKELTASCDDFGETKFTWKNATRDGEGHVTVFGSGLKPYTKYRCIATAENLAGLSDQSDELQFETLQDVPNEPNTLRVVDKSSDTIVISWEKPSQIPGVLKDYNVTVSCDGPQYAVPEDCLNGDLRPSYSVLVPGESSNVTLDNLSPYQECSIRVAASTDAGFGNDSHPVNTLTLPNVSDPVRSLRVDVHYNESVLTWQQPCFTNGILSYFTLKVTGWRDGYDPEPVKRWNRTKNTDVNENYVEYLTNLLPEYHYQVTISVLVEAVPSARPTIVQFTSSSQIPEQPPMESMENAVPDPKLTDRPSEQALVKLRRSIFNDEMGEIRYYALLVAQEGFLGPPQSNFLESNTSWPRMRSWANATKGSSVQLYQATPSWWNPFTDSSADEIEYVIGSESCSCDDVNSYCNGPLNPNTQYMLRIRAFTSAGYTDSLSVKFKTDPAFPYVLYIRLFLGLFVAGCIVILFIFLTMRKSAWRTGKQKPSQLCDSEKYIKELSAIKFLAYCNDVLANGEKMKAEFQQLGAASSLIQPQEYTAALVPGNRKKNRYVNILPYDSTRVVLDGDFENDYINASYIKDEFDRSIGYIACQGPKDDTTLDFWRMVVQCKVQSIVMLCNLREQGKSKCHWYFPEECETLTFGDISVECVEKNVYDCYIERILSVDKDEEPKKTVIHFHFNDWPDFGVPAEPATMLRFCQIVRSATGPTGMMAVHCSAGVGRTGTFIAVDILLRHIEQSRKVSVFKTVLRLREQRSSMVQTDVQYSYIYKSLKHALDNPCQYFRRGLTVLSSRRSRRNTEVSTRMDSRRATLGT